MHKGALTLSLVHVSTPPENPPGVPGPALTREGSVPSCSWAGALCPRSLPLPDTPPAGGWLRGTNPAGLRPGARSGKAWMLAPQSSSPMRGAQCWPAHAQEGMAEAPLPRGFNVSVGKAATSVSFWLPALGLLLLWKSDPKETKTSSFTC